MAVTFITVPVTPTTLIVEGYGVAESKSLIVTKVELVKEFVVQTLLPVDRKFVTIPKLLEPSCNCSTAMSVSPQAPLAVKEKLRLTGGPPAVNAP